AWEAKGDPEGVHFSAAARDAADGLTIAGTVEPGATSVLGAPVTCTGKGTCAFVAKLKHTGEAVWVKAFPSSAGTDHADLTNLAVKADGEITVQGGFDGTLDLGCGPVHGPAGFAWFALPNLFLARLSPSGDCLWWRTILGPPLFAPEDNHMAVSEA